VTRSALLLVAASLLHAGAACAAEPLLVLAGSASQLVLQDAAAEIERDLGLRVELDLGSSGALLAKLELTQRGDVYLPGSDDYLERAIERKLVDPVTRADYAVLRPALLVQRGNPRRIAGLADLARDDVRAAIGDSRMVCVGAYAEELLERAGLGDALMSRLARAGSCAALANLLRLGSVDAVLGWDVFTSWYPGEVETVPLPPKLVARTATVPGAVTVFSKRPADARRVVAWLAGPRGRELWRRHGYVSPEPVSSR
jgi:molybdate transport system substrate-binding protein